MYREFFNLKEKPFQDNRDIVVSEDEMMNERETGAYIRRCLRKAGTTEQIFFASALREVYKYSQGDAQLIDTLCDYALLSAYAKESKTINAEMISDSVDALLESKDADTVPDDKRRHKRLKTNLTGAYVHSDNTLRGLLTVTNLSRSGLQIKLNKQRIVKPGDRIVVNFTLDDDDKSEIRQLVIIKNVFGFLVGAAFNNPHGEAFEAYIKERIEA